MTARLAKQPKPVVIDFETFAIQRRPHYPPKPVGVSIKRWGQKPRYYAFGHPTGNNCTEAQAKAALAAVWQHKDGLLFQNGKFDLDVAETHWGLPLPSWNRIHETMFLLFLDDPHQTELGLKPSAERLLGLPPDEQDEVADWIIEHQPMPELRPLSPKTGKHERITRGKKAKHSYGAYIAYAPGDLVGKYANGDTDRTEQIFKLLWAKTQERQMLGAYDRERQLMLCLLDMERRGVRVDMTRLETDITRFTGILAQFEAWLTKRLKLPAGFNFDATEQVVAVLIDRGLADPSLMGVTAGGKVKGDKAALDAGVTDKLIAAVLKYCTQLKTCMKTFMLPWAAMARQSGGLIFTTWNQIRGAGVGTRTGRLSSTPNFQNIPKEFAATFEHLRTLEDIEKGLKLPKCPIKDVPPLPMVRGYIIPLRDDHILIGRDFSGQELRVFGHFEDGLLKDQYNKDPWLDPHEFARVMIGKMLGREFKRKPIKNLGFGLLYGMGLGKLCVTMDTTIDDAKEIKAAYLKLFPGLKAMYEDMRARAKANEPIRTWGGREYYCEPSVIINHKVMDFDYKLPNVLIQGSSADCTKEAVVEFYAKLPKGKDWRMLLQVHDELVVSVPRHELDEAMAFLRACMETSGFDVPMLSEGACSETNWASMKDYDVKGVIQPPFMPIIYQPVAQPTARKRTKKEAA